MSEYAEPQRGWIVKSHISWREEQMPTRMLSPEVKWIVRSHIGWKGERNISHKVWKSLPSIHVLTMRLTTIRNGPKHTISANNGLAHLKASCLCDFEKKKKSIMSACHGPSIKLVGNNNYTCQNYLAIQKKIDYG